MLAFLAITRIWPMALATVRSGWVTDEVKVVPTKGLPFFWKLLSQVAAKAGAAAPHSSAAIRIGCFMVTVLVEWQHGPGP